MIKFNMIKITIKYAVAVLTTLIAVQSVAIAAPAPSKSQVLPKSANAFIQRYSACYHYAGEFNGDGSIRDTQLNRQMAKLRCDIIEKDTQQFRKKYAANEKIMAAFAQVDMEAE